MKCARCPTTGPIGSVIMMLRDGMVPGIINMPRFIALCHECTRTENEANEYKRTKGGETADTTGMAG